MNADWIGLAIVLAWVLGGATIGIFVLIAAAAAARSHGRRTLRSVAEEFGGTIFFGGMDNIDQVTFRYRDVSVSVRHTADSLTQVLMTTPHAAVRLELKTEVQPADFFRKLLGMQDVVVGNSRFDDAYLVQGGDEAAVRRFLTPAVQAAAIELLRFKPRWPQKRGLVGLHVQVGPQFLGVTRGYPISNPAEMSAFVHACLRLHDVALGEAAPEGIDFVASSATSTAHCMVCGEALVQDVVYCRRCQTPHHRECWSFCGGCSTYGCREKLFLEPPPLTKAG